MCFKSQGIGRFCRAGCFIRFAFSAVSTLIHMISAVIRISVTERLIDLNHTGVGIYQTFFASCPGVSAVMTIYMYKKKVIPFFWFQHNTAMILIDSDGSVAQMCGIINFFVVNSRRVWVIRKLKNKLNKTSLYSARKSIDCPHTVF